MNAGFEAAIRAGIEALVGPDAITGLDFEAIETAARRQALRDMRLGHLLA